jgi:hypothetical protein
MIEMSNTLVMKIYGVLIIVSHLMFFVHFLALKKIKNKFYLFILFIITPQFGGESYDREEKKYQSANTFRHLLVRSDNLGMS